MTQQKHTLTIKAEHSGNRLDLVLAQLLPDLSRSRLQTLIANGSVLVNGRPGRKKDAIRGGDVVEIVIPEDTSLPINAETMTVPILYEDSMILVVNKPPDMAVHPGPGNREGTLVNELLGYNYDQFMEMMDDEERPGIVHRLDKDTSGVMVIARTLKAKAKLTDAFANRKVTKTYLAIVKGAFPKQSELRVETAIARHPVNRKKMAVCESGGKQAISIFSVLASAGDYHLIKANILTGRTHQIRVHLNHIGCPIIGDTVYGGKSASVTGPRQMLHAWKLVIPHPSSGEDMAFTAPIPADFDNVLRACGIKFDKMV